MVNILVAPDKFKGSLTAVEVCEAVAKGLAVAGINHTLKRIPLADGGEGTCELLTHYSKGVTRTIKVNGPLFTPVEAMYGVSADGTTAFVEMAKASGLQLVDTERRDPRFTTTFGTGELIRHATDQNVSTIILGIGGSATNDAGIGMAAALGYEFFDVNHKPLKPIGENLLRLHTISDKNVLPHLQKIKFVVLCDVTNPLHGPHGAAFVYAPQKGATPEIVRQLDAGLRNFGEIAESFFNTSMNFSGAGAAGGLGAGTRCFLGATLRKGIDYVFEATNLTEQVRTCDIIITGEGKLDDQSLSGKVVMAVTQIASQFQKPVVVVCGKNELTPELTTSLGIRAVISLVDDDTPERMALNSAHLLIQKHIARYFSQR